MKNFETQSTTVDKGLTLTGVIEQNTIEYKNKVYQAMAEEATIALADIFGLEEHEIKKLSGSEKIELSNENEINFMEAQLATMFGKYNEIMELNNSGIKQPISFAQVMQDNDLEFAA